MLMLLGYQSLRLGRQNLAALCTAAGKNLAAVGSSHSLTETVNLGTVTAAGLVGTLHDRIHLLSKSHMLNSQRTIATHNNRLYIVSLRYYNRKFPQGQQLFL